MGRESGVEGGAPPSFRELLRQYRDEAGLTQEELAKRAGLSVDSVSLLERNERQRPRAFTVRKLAEALQLSQTDRAHLEMAARRGGPPTAPAGSDLTELPGARPHNLPSQLTSFIGREREIAEVKGLLSASRSTSRARPPCGSPRSPCRSSCLRPPPRA